MASTTTSRSDFIQIQPDVTLHVVTTKPPPPPPPQQPVAAKTADQHHSSSSSSSSNSPPTRITEDEDNRKPTLVFLSYWGGSTRTWSHVIPLLAETYPTLAIDFRGWGESTGPDDPAAYSIAHHLAHDVETVLRKVDFHDVQDVVLVGLSMGAKVAQAIAGRRQQSRGDVPLCPSQQSPSPLVVKGAILVSPAPPTPLVLPPEASEQQIHAYDSWPTAECVARTVLTSHSSTETSSSSVVAPIDDETWKTVIADMLKSNASSRAAWPTYAMAEDITALAENIQAPVLVLAAEQDVVEPLERVRREVCGHIPGAELEVIPRSGHLSPVENPRAVAEHILGFLSRI